MPSWVRIHAMWRACPIMWLTSCHDDVIKWKHFPRYWPFVWEIHRSPVNSLHKGQWCGALMFSLIYTRINGWVNNGEAGDLRRRRAHYDVTVILVTRLSCGMTAMWHDCPAISCDMAMPWHYCPLAWLSCDMTVPRHDSLVTWLPCNTTALQPARHGCHVTRLFCNMNAL